MHQFLYGTLITVLYIRRGVIAVPEAAKAKGA